MQNKFCNDSEMVPQHVCMWVKQFRMLPPRLDNNAETAPNSEAVSGNFWHEVTASAPSPEENSLTRTEPRTPLSIPTHHGHKRSAP